MLLLPLLLAVVDGAAAQAAPPRDVRDVFLALPLPAAARDRVVLARVRGQISTAERRQAAMARALAAGKLQLDTRNGYLTLPLMATADEEYPALHLVVTYFVRSNGERLVVMQLQDYDTPTGSPLSEDYAWTLAGGRFTPQDIAAYLPRVEYGDFWTDPLPAGVARDFFLRVGAHYIEWPRQGTTAQFVLSTPDVDVETPQGLRLARLFDARPFTAVELVWDRQRGRFTKGKSIPYDPDGHDHVH